MPFTITVQVYGEPYPTDPRDDFFNRGPLSGAIADQPFPPGIESFPGTPVPPFLLAPLIVPRARRPAGGSMDEPEKRRNNMPFDIGPNLTGLAGSVLGGLLGGRRTAAGRTFQPGGQVTIPGTGIPNISLPMPGQVISQGCNCIIQRQLPARTVNMKGRAVFDANGQVVGCTPRKKRMNPMNGRAATRAARRLTSVMRFQKKIQKAVRRACGSKGGGGFRRTAAKKTCR